MTFESSIQVDERVRDPALLLPRPELRPWVDALFRGF